MRFSFSESTRWLFGRDDHACRSATRKGLRLLAGAALVSLAACTVPSIRTTGDVMALNVRSVNVIHPVWP